MIKYFLSVLMWIPALCLASSPLGLWRTYDLQNTPRSIIRINNENGQLVGTIVKVLPSNKNNASNTCEKCVGSLKGRPLVGMRILWGLAPGQNGWENGRVLDVDSGHVYSCRLTVSANNHVLNFSPYAMIPGLGPTLNWIRVKN